MATASREWTERPEAAFWLRGAVWLAVIWGTLVPRKALQLFPETE